MADKLNLNEVAEIVIQMEMDGKARRDRYQKIDNAMNCVFEPDPAVASIPYISGRHFALTDIADARNAGARTFSSLLPDIKISPVMDYEGEYDRVDKMEQAWKWEMEKLNRPANNSKGVHDKIVESAITYHAVALQTEYLPYKFKGKEKDPRIKAILGRKSFNWVVHNPSAVEAKYSDYGLECVRRKGEFTAQQLLENFGSDNPGIAKFLSENGDKKKSDLMKTKLTLVDYTDWKHRVQYIAVSNAPRYELMNEEHGLPFLPWVIVDYGDTLWQTVLDSGAWDNAQHMSLMKFSKAVAMGMRSDLVVETPDGKLTNIWIDYKNALNPIIIPTGSKISSLPSNNFDPAFEAMYTSIREDISRSTVARVLQDVTPYASSPFSSLNAAITTALGQLSNARKVAESAEAEAIYQGFQWIKHSKIPFVAYRSKSSDSKIENAIPNMEGGSIYITHEEVPTQEELQGMNEQEKSLNAQKTFFDLSGLYINVELKSANVTDEQAKMNLMINAMREAGMSRKEVWDKMGWNNFQMNQIQRASETLFDAELGKMVKLKDIEVQNIAMQQQAQIQQQQQQMQQQAQIQQQQQQMQQQMQQQAQINQMNAGSQFAPMQGMDMRGGSNPAAMQVPNENRNSITGKTQSGDAMV